MAPPHRMIILDKMLLPFAHGLGAGFHIIDATDTDRCLAVLRAEGEGVRVVISGGREELSGAAMAALPDLGLIIIVGAGMEGVDLDSARARGIKVTNAGDTHSSDVADHAVALALGARQKLLRYDAMVRSGAWQANEPTPMRHSLKNERVGIVGMGYIGKEIARKLEPFCPDIAWWSRSLQPDLRRPRMPTLAALAEWSSILILAARSGPETRRLISADVIDAIGPDGLFVNIARGFMVDEDALIAALREARLGQAAIDVFDHEPTPAARWRDVPNVLLSPHSGGFVYEAFEKLQELIVANIRAFYAGGELRYVVT